MYNMNEIECYENLANAIIVRAVEDYKEAKMSNPKSEKKKIEKEKIMQYRDWETDRKSTRLNSSHSAKSRMPSSA